MKMSKVSKNLYKKLQKQYSRKINLDLKRINFALKKLNNIHKEIKNPISFIGSDGKYSCLTALKYFIEENKQSVSCFTSPHLYDFRHRFWLENRFINTGEVKKNLNVIKKLKIKLTLFELLTIIYFLSASKLKKTSYALVEAGLLYAKDSTRVWDKPKCQIITNINEQHLEWVKPKNLQTICKQKVGYLSKKTKIYIGKQKPKTLKLIKKILVKNPSKKYFYGQDWSLKERKNKKIYQDKKGKIIISSKKILSKGLWENVALAIKVARDLNISKKVILKAIPKIQFEGRLQYITNGKFQKLLQPKETLLVDGCHSQTSAKNLSDYLKKTNKTIYGIWGIQKNKQPEIFIKSFKKIFKKIITVRIPDENNSCDPIKLKKIAQQNDIPADISPNITSAIKKLSNKQEKIIVCFGSLYLVGKILSMN